VKAKLEAQGTWSGELQQRTKSGRMVTVEARLDLEIVDGRRLVLESTHDITERKAMQERQQLLLRESTHRVKNTLAVVQSIARQTLRSTPSPSDFIDRFEGRLVAMANAHGLLVQSDWHGADLEALARVQLQAYAAAGSGRLRIEGPPVVLNADLATPFGLVLHELASNAAKYGSLSQRGGKVELGWTIGARNGQRHLTLVWRETGGPKVREPTVRGLGSNLIEGAIPGASVHREFGPEGLGCTIELALPEGPEHEEHA
jgi:two-component system, chemotaxis family, CheB/CheR fusion protein